MSQVSDVSIANQGFSAFRTELNNILAALNTMHSGTSRPASAAIGTMWLDTTNSASNSLGIKFFDGAQDISVATIDTSANTINFIDSVVTGFDIVGDTSPQLGGNLDTNSQNIVIDDAHGVLDENNNEQLIFQTTASAVNYAEITNNSTNNSPILSSNGSDTNVGLAITTKGTGSIVMTGAVSTSSDVQIGGTATGNPIIKDKAGDQTAGNVQYTFTGNTGTGMRRAAGDTLALDTGGAERLQVSNANIKLSMGAYSPEIALTDASTITWNASTQPVAKVVLTDNRTMGAASNGVAGQFISVLAIQDAGGGNTLAWNAVYEFTGDVAPVLTTTGAKGDLFVFRYNGAKWLEIGRNLNLTLS